MKTHLRAYPFSPYTLCGRAVADLELAYTPKAVTCAKCRAKRETP
jgi:hypothetical protein